MAVSDSKKPTSKTIAERFNGRKPDLDIVGFSAPWRPFASRERPRPADHRA